MEKLEIERIKNRDPGLDITRIIAFMCVPAVHFFRSSGFYGEAIIGRRMYVMVFFRTLFMICVPLFMLLTGYLMIDAQVALNKNSILKFYSKLKNVILVYIASTILILIFQVTILDASFKFNQILLNILRFDQYSWYVEMYIGLFLLIPFLNTLWNNIETQEGRLLLITVLLFISAGPSFFNIFDWSNIDALLHPWMTQHYDSIIPDWWEGIYPFTYYYIGGFIKKEVDIKSINTAKGILLLVLSVMCFGIYNIWRSYSIPFQWGRWCSWGSIQNTVDAVLVFLIINSISYEKMSLKIRHILQMISKLTFGAYLLSWIPDCYFYNLLEKAVPLVKYRLNYAPIMIFNSIIIALILSLIVDLLITYMTKGVKSLKNTA